MQSNEILEVVDSVSTEKGLDKDVIFKAIEIAKCGIPCKKFIVPSIGSIIQIFSLSVLLILPTSSERKE